MGNREAANDIDFAEWDDEISLSEFNAHKKQTELNN